MNKTEETVNMNKSPYISDTETLYLALKSGIEESIKDFRVWYDHGSIEMIDDSKLVLKYQCLPDIPSLLDITLPVDTSKKLQYSKRSDQRGIAWCWKFSMKIQTFFKVLNHGRRSL